ncbi:MAG: hypothetical protein N2578_03465, partial [Bdellovibrionaceae bacterium]|nr:hypothetical protein [Pseudobdellovibrionaceae bacterium]
RIRSDVQKKLEELRAAKMIGASLEAHVDITAEGSDHEILSSAEDLREFLIVSTVNLQRGPYTVNARKADGEKCVRCWTYSTRIGEEQKFPGVCPKCVEALR